MKNNPEATVMTSNTMTTPIALPANRSLAYRRHSGSCKRVRSRTILSAKDNFFRVELNQASLFSLVMEVLASEL